MVMKIWLSAVALVSVSLGISVDHVPNQCPAEDGKFLVFFSHPDDCQLYFMCDHGEPLLRKCSEGSVWDDVYQVCVVKNSQYDTCTYLKDCENDRTLLTPHPSMCQRYYNCSNTSPPWTPYLKQYELECPYPQGFDAVAKKCLPYTEVNCGSGRVLAKDPCDYVMNKCGSAHCEPCSSRLPSCVGLSDGLHEHPQRLWTPYYIICKDERNVGPGHYYCERHALTDTTSIFSPVKDECVSAWEVPREHGGLAPTCAGKAPGQSYRSDERPDVYYSCPDAQVSYCGLENVFNESSQQCESSK